MLHSSNVRPPAIPLTELEARELLAKPLLALCSEHGPTAVGRMIGCDEKTVRNARDEKSTLSLDSAVNLLLLDGTAFEPFLDRLAGRRSVPIGAVCNTDPLHAMTGAVHKLAVAGAINSPSALLDAEPQLRGAFDAIACLLRQIDVVRAAA